VYLNLRLGVDKISGEIGFKLNLGNLSIVGADDGNRSVGTGTHSGKRPLKFSDVPSRIHTSKIFTWNWFADFKKIVILPKCFTSF
jgi:hypothetical protein